MYAEKSVLFTHDEALFNRVTDARMREILDRPDVTIYQPHESSNSFGEFLFITVEVHAKTGAPADRWTFYGYGFSDAADRWVIDSWTFYFASLTPTEGIVTAFAALVGLDSRRMDIGRWAMADMARGQQQSARGQLFDLLTEASDEDAALCDVEDFFDDL